MSLCPCLFLFFHVKLYNCGSLNKNAPAQSYLSGGAIVPKETQGGNWIFASTRQARV